MGPRMSLASHVVTQTDKAEMNTTTQTNKFRETLAAEASAYDVTLTLEAIAGLSRYYELLSLWNSRIHLVAPCSADRGSRRRRWLANRSLPDCQIRPARNFDRVFAKESCVLARGTDAYGRFLESQRH